MAVFRRFWHIFGCALFALIVVFGANNSYAANCGSNQVDVDGTCYNGKFAIKTTPTTDSFQFKMSAVGEFTVNCGNGGVLTSTDDDITNGNTITRSVITETTYTCSWSSAGAHVIVFDMITVTGYSPYADAIGTPYRPAIRFNATNLRLLVESSPPDTNAQKVAAIYGSLGAMLPTLNNVSNGMSTQPKFDYTFYGCTGLTSLPTDLFNGVTGEEQYRFFHTFEGCTGLTSLPTDSNGNSTLFNGVSGARSLFDGTFAGCTGLTSLPSKLFNNITVSEFDDNLFAGTFEGCTGLTSLPTDLFDGVSGVSNSMFFGTFGGCTGLISLPTDSNGNSTLFKNINTAKGWMFAYTFSGCTGLTHLPFDLFKNVSGAATHMFFGTFGGCTGLTSLPTDSNGNSTLFNSINAARDGVADNMFASTFAGCTGLTSLPHRLFNNIGIANTEMFENTFGGCTGLTSLPTDSNGNSTLFNGISGGANSMFENTFRGCTGLTSLPYKLFDGVDAAAFELFRGTFYNCTGLTSLPTDLFDGIDTVAGSMFNATFSGCSGLTSLPTDSNGNSTLFKNIEGHADSLFAATFSRCTGLRSLPSDLFDGVDAAAKHMFLETFKGCSGLTLLPPDLFSGVSGTASHLFNTTFENCTGLTSIPVNLFDHVVGAPQSYMFYSTFYGDTSLSAFDLGNGVTTSYIPATFLSGVNNGSAELQTRAMFGNTQLASPCPSGTQDVTRAQFNDAWKPWCSVGATITLDWDENGGTSVANGTCVYGGNLVLPAAPTRTNWTFTGWKTADNVVRDAGTTIADGCISTYIGTTTNDVSTAITAQWTPVTYTVTFDANGGTIPRGGTTSVDVPYSQALPTINTAKLPTRASTDVYTYAFDGYYDYPVAGTKYYNADGTPVSGVTWNQTRNGTLYAQWRVTACATGYTLQSNVDLRTIIGQTGYNNYHSEDDGSYSMTYGDKGIVYVMPRCSPQSGINNDLADTYTIPTTFESGASLGDTEGTNCYCQIIGYKASGSSTIQSLHSAWIYNNTDSDCNSNYAGCGLDCAMGVGNGVFRHSRYRARMFEAAMCKPNTYTITFNANGGTIPSGGTTSATAVYNELLPSVDATKLPTRATTATQVYRFDGYYDTSASTGGTKYYNANGSLATNQRWTRMSNLTLYARWIVTTCPSGSNTLELSNLVGDTEATNVTTISNNGTDLYENAATYGLTSSDINRFVVDYGNNGKITGRGICSTTPGNTVDDEGTIVYIATGNPDDVVVSSAITSAFGTGAHCWCKIDGYIPDGGTRQDLTSLYISESDYELWADEDESAVELCAENCSAACADMLYWFDDSYPIWRTAAFNAVTPCSNLPLIFDLNGGTGNAPTAGAATYGQAMPTLSTTVKPTKTGYAFGGWYDTPAATGGTAYYTRDGGSARTWDKQDSSAILYARWVPVYTVTLNANGGSPTSQYMYAVSSGNADYGSNLSAGIYCDAAATVTAWGENITSRCGKSLPDRTGHTFNGYFNASSGGNLMITRNGYIGYDDEDDDTGELNDEASDSNGNFTIYAQWTANPSNLTFDLNGGTGTAPTAGPATAGQPMPTLSTTVKPTKEGYAFGGWWDESDIDEGAQYYHRDGSSARNWDRTGTNVTLYARWVPVYTITLFAFRASPSRQYMYAVSEDYEDDGVPFGVYFDAAATVNASNKFITDYKDGQGNSILVVPTRDGYTFNGFYYSGQKVISETGFTSVEGDDIDYFAGESSGNFIVTADWTGDTITLDWNEYGGTSIANGTCTYGDNLVLPAAPTRSGFVFDGWQLANGSTRDPGETVTGGCISTYIGETPNNVSTSITAVWLPVYEITLSPNGGTGSTYTFYKMAENESLFTDAACTQGLTVAFDYGDTNLTEEGYPLPTRTGYTFAGYSSPTCGVVIDDDGYYSVLDEQGITQEGECVAEDIDDDETWNAQWTPNTNTKYTVRHYTRDLDASPTYTLHSTEEKYGTTESTVTLANLKKTITGFTYNKGYVAPYLAFDGTTMHPNQSATTTTTILADGSRVIDLYYDRNTFIVRLTQGTGISRVIGSGPHQYGETVTIDATVRDGYTWSNWTQTDGGAQVTTTKQYTFTMPNEDVAYTANATSNTYNITYMDGGVAMSGINPATYTAGTSTTINATPSKAHGAFDKWCTDSGLTNCATTQTIATTDTGDKTFYAKFTCNPGYTQQTPPTILSNFTVNDSCVSNRASGGWGTREAQNFSCTRGSELDIYTWLFEGKDADSHLHKVYGETTCIDVPKTTESGVDPTLNTTRGLTTGEYCWCRLTDYQQDDGETINLDSDWFYVDDFSTDANASCVRYCPDYCGMRFRNNMVSHTTESISVYNESISNDATICAPNTYTVTYDENKPSNTSSDVIGTTADSIHTYGIAKALTSNGYSLPGYTFAGWATSASGNVVYSNGQSVTNLTNIDGATVTLYAKWTPSNYTITYHLAGGTNNSGNPTSYTATSPNITFAPATKSGYIFGGWYTDANFTTRISGINTGTTTGNLDLYVYWADDSFQLTTKSTNAFSFYISAGGTFYIDWGDGAVDIITKAVGHTLYSHSYDDTDTYTIRIGGRATGYDTATMAQLLYYDEAVNHDTGAAISFVMNDKINTITGSLGSIFGTLTNGQNPSFNGTFTESSLSGTIPSTLFTGIYGAPSDGMFKQTFEACTGLTGTIPATLFAGLYGAPTSGMFNDTFDSCSGLSGSIPGTLFCQNTESPNATNCIYGAPAEAMFEGTFRGCSGLTGSIPAKLFAGINGTPASYMFAGTFENCSGLDDSIPATLFAGINGTPAVGMFGGTFSGCSSLSGYIPPTLFAGISQSTTANSQMDYIFYNSGIATSCTPYGLQQYRTGFESYWNYPNATTAPGQKVSCAPAGYTITYVLDGGTNSANNPLTYTEDSETITLENPTKTNWYFDGWYTDAQFTQPITQIVHGSTGDITLYAKWIDAKFILTTTNTTTSFQFVLTAAGNFTVDCGDGGTLSSTANDVTNGNTITRNDTNKATYTCEWTNNPGAHQIKFNGAATGYTTQNGGTVSDFAAIRFRLVNSYSETNAQKIASISGSLGQIFGTIETPTVGIGQPRFAYTFSRASNMTGSIPANLLNGIHGAPVSYMFYYTFHDCSRLTSLPSGLFNGISGAAQYMFSGTFANCSRLTSLPPDLFKGISGAANYMFAYTFSDCSGLTSLPTDNEGKSTLFKGVSGAANNMFTYTFENCTGLTSLPSGLFDGISGAATSMFERTFIDCSGLTSLPPDLFKGISGAADNMFSGTFENCTGLTSLPSGLFDGISGSAKSMFGPDDSVVGGGGTFSGCTSLKTVPADLFAGASGTPNDLMFGGTFYNDTALDTFVFSDGTTVNYIPAGFFGTLNGSDYESYAEDGNESAAMAEIFYGNTVIADTCPSGTVQNITGFEDDWNDRVSCTAEVSTVTLYQNITDNDATDTVNGTVIAHYNTAMPSVDNNNQPLSAPTRTGKTFIGYFDARVGGNKYYNADMSSARNWDGINITGKLYAQWGTGKFQLTTTETNHFEFKMSAAGEFTVDWGDGNVQTISRDNTTETTYTHDYDAYKSYVISFDGEAEGYANNTSAAIKFLIGSDSNDANVKKIASISGSLGQIFKTVAQPTTGIGQPKFFSTFSYASNMTGSIPPNLFNGVSGAPEDNMFRNTFADCSGLSGSIPATLFAGIHGAPANYMFASTFSGCSGLTGSIPATLFCQDTENPDATNCIYGAPAATMFSSTFSGCSGLSGSIPATLFAGIHGAPKNHMFQSTFYGCRGLTGSIPATLFCQDTENPDATNCIYGAPAISMFDLTFRNCSGLIGVIPATLFAGIHGTPQNYMFARTFDGCSGLTGSIPATLFAGIHGAPARNMFDSTFNGCGGLTGSIPATLFCQNTENPDTTNCIYGAPADSMFVSTFHGCSGLTGSIPSTLFAGIHGAPKYEMFGFTFYNCSGLTGSIPGTLFCQNPENPDATNCIYGVAQRMFVSTFLGCSGLTGSIPATLFAGIHGAPAEGMFASTFKGCSALSSYIPPSLFAGVSQSTTAGYQMKDVFSGSGLATSCAPYGMQQYRTGFESYFSGKVSCARTYPFSLTTTSTTDHFEFKMSAAGEFYVDWGDGTIETISRTNNLTETTYSHDYDDAGAYTIRFGGESKGYSTNDTAAISFNKNGRSNETNATKIASISGSLGQIFKTLTTATVGQRQPRFYATFRGASNMSGSIPENLFNGIYDAPVSYMFSITFDGCSGLTGSIPETLFAGLSGAPAGDVFQGTFSDCSGLTGSIPATLFAGIHGAPADEMFFQTFSGCSGLTGSIPGTLFCQNPENPNTTNCIYGAPAYAMFNDTFNGCSGLTGSIPAKLFAGIHGTPAEEMFYGTFAGCSGLSSYIPPALFAGISTETTATGQMDNIFYNSGIATSCEPYGMQQYITGFESYWNYPNATTVPGQKVSCNYAPMTVDLYQNSDASDNTINATITAIYGQPMPLFDTSENHLVKPTLTGYLFGGYYDARSGGVQYYTSNMTSARNWDKTTATPLYARWNGSSSGCQAGHEKLYTMTGVNGSDFTYDKNTFTWSIVFPYGVINGGSACLTNNGKNKGTTDSTITANVADSNGQYCWCKVTGPEESLWTYNYKASNQSGCNTNCARLCANYGSSQSELRSGLYSRSGDIGNYCVGTIYSCPAGEYLNIDHCQLCEPGHYCPGNGNGGSAVYSYNGEIQGREDCKANATSPAGSTAASACVCKTGYDTSTPNASPAGTVLSSGNGKWSVEFPYGILSGHSICVSASGSTRGQTTSGSGHVAVTGEEAGGKYCWCQMDSLAPSVYTYSYTAASESACNTNCPSKCATNIAQYEDMRTGLFTGIANMCTAPKYTCPAGQYLNVDECKLCEVGHWCPGGTWYFNEEIQGRNDCQPTYSTSSEGSSAVSACHCITDTFDLRGETDTDGNSHTVDGANYQVVFDYGKLSGTSACLDYKKGSKGTNDPDATAEPGDAEGKYCWCKMTFPVDGYWTFNYEAANDGACSRNCPEYCANYTKTQEQLRTGVFLNQYNTTCMPEPVTCNPGYYLPQNSDVCAICIANKYCEGGTFVVSTTQDQGIKDCPTNSYSAAGASECTCLSGYVDLLANVETGGTDANWNASAASWSTVFDYITLKGASACLDEEERVQGTVRSDLDPDAGDADGKYCYCLMTHPGQNSWAYNYTASSTDACSANCARMCATNARNKQDLRAGLYYNGQDKLCLPSRFYINYVLNGGYGCTTEMYYYGVGKEITCEPLRAGYTFLGWFDNDEFENEVTAISDEAIGDKTLYAKWEAISYPFTVDVTTTEDDTVFTLKLSASGVFHINWGDDVVDVIEKQDVLNRTYTHTYTEAGDYTIGISGTPSAYSESSSVAAISFTNNEYVTGISGSLGSLFPTITVNGQTQHPRFHSTFYGCSNLGGTIPENLFAGITGTATYMFYATFKDCPELTGSIPANLFATISGNVQEYMFSNTFNGCTSLSGNIPANLFRGITGTPQHSMFYSTFARCAGLTGSIPADLFCYNQANNICIAGAPAKSMFSSTFNGCTSLSGNIPAGLFRGITGTPETNMFDSTFAGDYGLQGSIPANLFCYNKQNNICISGAPANSMFNGTFSGCAGLTGSIPAALFQGITGQPAFSMFRSTFYGCSQLSGSIPENLFCYDRQHDICVSGTPVDNMFNGTFAECSSLTGSIPEKLFEGISGAPAENMFRATFKSATGLQSYIPAFLFKNILTITQADNQMLEIFNSTNLLEECPTGTIQYITGFESWFDEKVACTPVYNIIYDYTNGGGGCPNETYSRGIGKTLDCDAHKDNYIFVGWFDEVTNGTQVFEISSSASGDITLYAHYVEEGDNLYLCEAGRYLPANTTTCKKCLVNHYCPGLSGAAASNVDQGIYSCPNGLFAPKGMQSASSCGRILHIGDDSLYLNSTKRTEKVLVAGTDKGNFYGNLQTTETPISLYSDRKLHIGNYYAYDDSLLEKMLCDENNSVWDNTTFTCNSNFVGNTSISSFTSAKNKLLNNIYYDHRETFYCHASFDENKDITLPVGFTTPAYENRKTVLEIEHAIPAAHFGSNFTEWTVGDPRCVHSDGTSYAGRACAELVNLEFKYMLSDLYNLYPAIGSVNAMRSNYPYTELPNVSDYTFGTCPMKISEGYVEPPVYTRGAIARTYLYFDATYPKYTMPASTRSLMNVWNTLYPVTEWECLRANRIETLQGNSNYFVKRQCITASF